MKQVQRIRTISEFHRTRQLPPPEHPLISIVDYAAVEIMEEFRELSWVFDFYFIALKRNIGATIRYGQQAYDFDEGVMFFIGPGQVFSIERDAVRPPDRSGWMLLIHPDFLWKTSLGKNIGKYDYFGYALHEALFVSKKEEDALWGIIENIRQEYHSNIDKYSQQIIVSQLETLLGYAERFYNRQFITRKKANHAVLDALDLFLTDYFNDAHRAGNGLPSITDLAAPLNMSPKYLSSLLKVLTGQTAQQHIHGKLIAKAKEQLSITQLSISEIAYALGFEHPQSFSKLFRQKTSQTPQEFRESLS